MTEITDTKRISCGKKTCNRCAYRNYDYPFGLNPKDYNDYCYRFLKGMRSDESSPLRLPECIEAENWLVVQRRSK